MENVIKNVEFELQKKIDEKTKEEKMFLLGKVNIDGKNLNIYVHPRKTKKTPKSPDYVMSYNSEKSNFIQCGMLWNRVSKKNNNIKFKSGIFKYNNNDYSIVLFKNKEFVTKFDGKIDFTKVLQKQQSNVVTQQNTNEVSPF